MKQRIGLYTWDVLFVDKEVIKGCEGQTRCNDLKILIRNDLPLVTTEIVIRHEVVHALLDTQGRVYQKKFDVEEVCEFIAWRLPEINQIVENIMLKKGGNAYGKIEKKEIDR